MTASMDMKKLAAEFAKYPKPKMHFSYGTAGFRTSGDMLESTVFRMGVLAALRSQHQGNAVIGVMLTASHNIESDNGVKIVDPMGDMLEQSWEGFCTEAANAETFEQFLAAVGKIGACESAQRGQVAYGFDTRPSRSKLERALVCGLAAVSATVHNYGEVTTPQLHYFVRSLNTQESAEPFGAPTEHGYYSRLRDAFVSLVGQRAAVGPELVIDCANGVGAPKTARLIECFASSTFSPQLENSKAGALGKLNYRCGADFVKTTQGAPDGVALAAGSRYCSYDGDADRLVYYYVTDAGQFRLLDGDKIASLAAMYLQELCTAAGFDDLRLGVVQTAYANGNSTRYLREVLKVPVEIASTGVKHLHHAAQKFDIGVYFEANGHGTVLFGSKAQAAIKSAANSAANSGSPAQLAARKLQALQLLINQTVGDAISDMLMVEVILAEKKLDLPSWDNAYSDLPNRLLKVIVADRSIFKTTNAEQTLTSPKGLQNELDKLVNCIKIGRSFVRPSGTEDAVRVYAEAATQQDCISLANAAVMLVFNMAGGVGEPPCPLINTN